MEKTRMYFVRHGQSEGNLKDLFLGHTDLDLTEKGHLQAEMVSGYFREIPVDAIYSSDLLRAYHTALPTARAKKISVIRDEGLREINAGEWEGLPFPTLIEQYRESFEIWRSSFSESRCDGGESIRELSERVVTCVRRIAEENKGKTVVVFSHATPIRILKAHWDGATGEAMNSIPWPANASVSCAEYENGSFHPLEYSADSFLGDFVTRLE